MVWYNKIIMNIRKIPLVNGQYYHVFSRSIAGYEIFNQPEDFGRMVELFNLYHYEGFAYSYSKFHALNPSIRKQIFQNIKASSSTLVDIIAYCVMPTHIHLILKQNTNDGISKFVGKILNSYSRYFNIKYHRAGPLWEGRFKNVLVNRDEQLMHLTRYLHLNPTSAGLSQRPEDWSYSSYKEYIDDKYDGICRFQELFDFNVQQYRDFVNDRKSYQRELSIIKNILID